MEEISLRLTSNDSAKDSLHLIDNELGHGIDASGAINIARLGGKVLTLQLHGWVLLLQLVKIMPMSGCRLTI